MRVPSLNRQVSFQQVLPLLGSPVRSNALPTLATCPVCHAVDQLFVTMDSEQGGDWAYCRVCGFAGDMIALAAATWKLGIRLTLRKLSYQDEISSAIGDELAIAKYESMYNTPKTRILEFWEKCRETHYQAETPQLRLLQHRLGSMARDQEWKEKAGRFIGSCHRKEIDLCFNPETMLNWEQTRTSKSGKYRESRTFRGRDWNDLLIVPYYDLPGRICGFLCIGRDGKPETDFVYRGVMYGSDEAGIGMLPALLRGNDKKFGNTKFIFTDAEMAIRFHVRHGNSHYSTLPLGATWDDGKRATSRVWDWFHCEQLIFWGSDRLKTIAQARKGNGRVVMLNVTSTELETNMRNYSPEEWLVRMRPTAIPWAAALQEYLKALGTEMEIEEALLSLKLQGRELDAFTCGCPEDLQNRLKFVTAHRTFAAKVQFQGDWVFEKADGWYLEKGGERITNMIVRVEQVLTTIDNRSYYRGIIKFNGKVYPFTEKASILDKNLLRWAQVYLRDIARAGVSEYYPNWNSKAINVAFAFHTPHYAQGVEVIGWDQVNRQFNFPKFSIKAGGEVTTDFTCLFDNAQVPGRDLPLPGMIPRRHMETLSEINDETAIFWATTACVAANIVAQAVNRNQSQVLLDGPGAQGVGTSAAIRLGCVEIEASKFCNVDRLLDENRNQHAWPLLLTGEIARIGSWLDHAAARNCILSLPPIATKVLAIRGRANIIYHRRKLGSMQLAHHAAVYILPNYIQDLYRRNIFLPDDQPDLAADVLADMSNWFAKLGGNRKAVESAGNILHTPRSKSAAEHFGDLAFQLHADGLLSFSQDGLPEANTSSIVLRNIESGKGVWVSQDRFSDAVRQAGSVLPDLLLITKSLAESGVLLSESTYNNRRGWLVPEDWWNNRFENWRAGSYADT